jgi:hypothetical protein
MGDPLIQFDDDREGWMNSLNAETVVVAGGPRDTTVRPVHESVRKSLERKGLIPPSSPPNPPAEKG